MPAFESAGEGAPAGGRFGGWGVHEPAFESAGEAARSHMRLMRHRREPHIELPTSQRHSATIRLFDQFSVHPPLTPLVGFAPTHMGSRIDRGPVPPSLGGKAWVLLAALAGQSSVWPG